MQFTLPRITVCLVIGLGAFIALAAASVARADPPADGFLSPSWQGLNGIPGLFTTSFNLRDYGTAYPFTAYPYKDIATSAAIQADGKVIVGGYVWNEIHWANAGLGRQYTSEFGCAVERYNADGSVDTSFGDNGSFIYNFNGYGDRIDCMITSVRVLNGGILMVTGYEQTHEYNVPAVNLALQIELTSSGSPNPGVVTGTANTSIAQTVDLDGGGQGLFAAGTGHDGSNADSDFYYMVGGLNNPQFQGFVDVTGSSNDDSANAAVIESNGAGTKELYLVGTVNMAAWTSGLAHHECAVVALHQSPGGPIALDANFGNGGKLFFDDLVFVNAIGQSVDTDTVCKAAVARPKTGGNWNTGIIVGGERMEGTGTNQQSYYLLDEVSPEGTVTYHDYDDVDQTWFTTYGAGVYNSINAMALQADGKLLIAGTSGNDAFSASAYGQSDVGLLRLNADFTTRDVDFFPASKTLDGRAGLAQGQTEYATALRIDAPRNRILVVGVRSADVNGNIPTDYNWLLGAASAVQDRIFGDNFDGPYFWIY